MECFPVAHLLTISLFSHSLSVTPSTGHQSTDSRNLRLGSADRLALQEGRLPVPPLYRWRSTTPTGAIARFLFSLRGTMKHLMRSSLQHTQASWHSRTGIPFMLEDRSGSLSGSEFVDLYDRMCLRVRCTRRDTDGASQYGVYNMFSTQPDIPVVTLEYGAAGALGNVTTIGPGGSSRTQTMAAFLVEVGGPCHRKFIASDGQEYIWSWRTNTRENHEWSCVNASGQNAAWYALKIPGEQYANSSGCMLGVEEPYPHLAVDFLATLLIMRHIAARTT